MEKKNAALFVFVLIFCFVLLELSIRIFLPQTLNIYKYNKDYVFEFRPRAELNYVRGEFSQQIKFNSEGFRDKERDYFSKNETIYRIAFLGDSFVSALEVSEENRTSNILEKELNKQFNSSKNIKVKFEVLNLGINGYSTEQELLQLEKKIINYNPDLIILNYYIGNDQIDNYERKIFEFKEGKLSVNQNRIFSQRWPRSIFYFLTGKSHLISLIFNNYQRIISYFNHSASDIRKEVGAGSGKEFIELSILKNETEMSKTIWQKTELLLKNISSFAEEKDKKFVVIIIPDRIQENEKDLKYLLSANNFSESDIDIERPQKTLTGFFEKEKINYLDLLPVLKNKSSEIHYGEDFHWNEKGHKLVAEKILQKLINESIILIQ